MKSAFPTKDKLCFKIRYKKEDDFSYDIWEIDPSTAQVRGLLTFPDGINFVIYYELFHLPGFYRNQKRLKV